MTRYFTMVADELLEELRAGVLLPPCLRLVREIGPARRDNVNVQLPNWLPAGYTTVEFEDDEADPSLDGKLVTPVVSREFGRTAENEPARPGRVWVSARIVEAP